MKRTLPWGAKSKKNKRDAKRLYDVFGRDPESNKFFKSKEWRAVRQQVLEAEPLCRRCLAKGIYKVATCVDHVIPRSQIDRDAWLDIDNLQPLDVSCHNVKTYEDIKKYGRS